MEGVAGAVVVVAVAAAGDAVAETSRRWFFLRKILNSEISLLSSFDTWTSFTLSLQ